MFEYPNYSFGNVFFTAMGAIVFWSRYGKNSLKVYVLSNLLDVIPMQQGIRIVIELLVFVFLGCVIGIALVEPLTAIQAISAGMGWTGLLAQSRIR